VPEKVEKINYPYSRTFKSQIKIGMNEMRVNVYEKKQRSLVETKDISPEIA